MSVLSWACWSGGTCNRLDKMEMGYKKAPQWGFSVILFKISPEREVCVFSCEILAGLAGLAGLAASLALIRVLSKSQVLVYEGRHPHVPALDS